jgi:uncharacterized membrane protein (UPF0127 family)
VTPLLFTFACEGAQPDRLDLVVDGTPILVEVADEPPERSLGLMYRDTMGADHGMLFVYPDAEVRSFWMKNTRLPLSIAYLDAAGTIVHIADMRPLDTTAVPSVRPAMYALEVHQGWFAAHGVEVGDKVTGLPGPSKG